MVLLRKSKSDNKNLIAILRDYHEINNKIITDTKKKHVNEIEI